MTIQLQSTSDPASGSFSVNELSLLTELPLRTVRYYITQGLVDRPHGEKRGAWYDRHHLEQLLQIRKWSSAGVSLERIRELLHGAPPPVPPRERAIGSVSVCSHLAVAEGVEVVIDPQRAGLSPEAVRQFIQGVMAAFEAVQGQGGAASHSAAAHNTDKNDRQAGEP